MNQFSFVVRLRHQDGRNSFVKAVDKGEITANTGSESPKILHPSSKKHRMRRLPRDYAWSIGERVALVAFTAAGLVPTSILGDFQGFTCLNGRKKAVVTWDQENSSVSGTVAIQRIRPISFIPS